MEYKFDDPQIGQCSLRNAAVVFNNYLLVLGPIGGSNQNAIRGFPLSSLQPGATLPVPSASDWSSMPFAVNGGNTNINSHGGVSAVVAGATLYFFWQDDRGLMAAQISNTSLDFSNSSAQKPWFNLSRIDGTPLPGGNNSDVTATVFDADDLLVATILPDSNQLYIGRFQPDALPTTAPLGNNPGTWQALNEWTFSALQVLGAGNENTNLGTALSADWYSPDGQTFYYLFVIMPPDNPPGNVCRLLIDAISMPYMDITVIDQLAAFYFVPGLSPRAPFVVRDPAGRVCIYIVDQGTSIIRWTQPGNQAPGRQFLEFSSAEISYQNGSTLNGQPVGAAAVFLADAKPILATVENDPNVISVQNILAGATTLPVAEVIFVPDQNWELMCFSQPYGALQQVINLTLGTTESTKTVVLRGIVDGPIPVPNQNAIATRTGGADCGDLIYGTMLTDQTERTVSGQVTAGFIFNSQYTKGVGPALQISFMAGYGRSATNMTGTQTIANISCPSKLDLDSFTVIPDAQAYSSAVTVPCTLYRFLVLDPDNSGHYTVATDASTNLSLYPQFVPSAVVDSTFVQFVPYSVKPGDLMSYTRSAWNTRMQALGYGSANYFEEVILPAAYPFQENQPYIECTWNNGTWTPVQDNVFLSNVTESSWSFQMSAYVGLSGGFDVTIPDAGGEAMNYSFLVGGSVTVQGSTQEVQQSQWGVTVSAVNIPVPAASSTAPYVYDYTFRIYFLPASASWCKELLQYYNQPLIAGAANELLSELNANTLSIDPNSAPWRIVYEVTSVTFCDPSVSPPNFTQYPGPPPPAPVAPSFVNSNGQVNWMYQNGGNQIWTASAPLQVQYAVTFSNGVQTTGNTKVETAISPLSGPVTVGTGMCPELTIPLDSSGWATARNLYRSFNGQLPPQLVLTIPDNTSTTCFDNNPSGNFSPPGVPIQGYDVAEWQCRSNLEGSIVWVPGNSVQYAVSFVYNTGKNALAVETYGESLLGPNGAPEWTDKIAIDYYGEPTLTGVPLSNDTGAGNTPECLARNIYRICWDANGNLLQNLTLVAQIADNETTTVSDLLDSAGLSLKYATSSWPSVFNL